MSCVIQQACQLASGLSGANPLELCRQIYLTQDTWCRQRQIPFFDLLLQGDLGFDANWF